MYTILSSFHIADKKRIMIMHLANVEQVHYRCSGCLYEEQRKKEEGHDFWKLQLSIHSSPAAAAVDNMTFWFSAQSGGWLIRTLF